jgi:hypothetical protein
LVGTGCVGDVLSPCTGDWGTGFFVGPNRLVCHTVENIAEPLLAHLCDSLDILSVHPDVNQVGCRRQVVVPQPVVDHLKVPDAPPVKSCRGCNLTALSIARFERVADNIKRFDAVFIDELQDYKIERQMRKGSEVLDFKSAWQRSAKRGGRHAGSGEDAAGTAPHVLNRRIIVLQSDASFRPQKKNRHADTVLDSAGGGA